MSSRTFGDPTQAEVLRGLARGSDALSGIREVALDAYTNSSRHELSLRKTQIILGFEAINHIDKSLIQGLSVSDKYLLAKVMASLISAGLCTENAYNEIKLQSNCILSSFARSDYKGIVNLVSNIICKYPEAKYIERQVRELIYPTVYSYTSLTDIPPEQKTSDSMKGQEGYVTTGYTTWELQAEKLVKILVQRSSYFRGVKRWRIPPVPAMLRQRIAKIFKVKLPSDSLSIDTDDSDYSLDAMHWQAAFIGNDTVPLEVFARTLEMTRVKGAKAHEMIENILSTNNFQRKPHEVELSSLLSMILSTYKPDDGIHIKSLIETLLKHLKHSPYAASGPNIDRDIRTVALDKGNEELRKQLEMTGNQKLMPGVYLSALEQATNSLMRAVSGLNKDSASTRIGLDVLEHLIADKPILIFERLFFKGMIPTDLTTPDKPVSIMAQLMFDIAIDSFDKGINLWMIQSDAIFAPVLKYLFGEDAFLDLSSTTQVRQGNGDTLKADSCNTMILDIRLAMRNILMRRTDAQIETGVAFAIKLAKQKPVLAKLLMKHLGYDACSAAIENLSRIGVSPEIIEVYKSVIAA